MAQSIETNGDVQEAEGVDIGRKHKLGHLRVDTQGNATFKRLPTNQLVDALQLGIQFTVGGLEARPAHDILFQDCFTVEIINFPKEGRPAPSPTPPHRFSDFTIRSYAPIAFRHFREKFNIKPEDFLSSICNKPLRELKNPGASGSLFYLTSDDQFILKTVQKKEAEFLKSLLPGYYMNVTQNVRTLLPKYFGLYCYQGDNKNIRLTVMNNLIPSHVQMHEKYDLKGSTHKRLANNAERGKTCPTWKDLDFIERHPGGLLLDVETYNALKKTVERDCRVLASFQIMDYSFLIGVHQVDPRSASEEYRTMVSVASNASPLEQPKRMMYSTPMDNIQAEFDEHNKPDDRLARTGGIPARTASGQILSLYVGIIDILQSYQLRKRLEHTFKSVVTDGTQISVTNPNFYSERFQKFLFTSVFRKAPSLRDSVYKRSERPKSVITAEQRSSLRDARPYVSLEIPPAISSVNNRRHQKPSQPNYAPSNCSTETADSHITSIEYSRQSDERNKRDSSTTLYASSRQSDSLYNQPTGRKLSSIQTTSFNSNHMSSTRQKFYQDLSAPPKKNQPNLPPMRGGIAEKTTRSTADLAYQYSPIQHQEKYPSSDEITRF